MRPARLVLLLLGAGALLAGAGGAAAKERPGGAPPWREGEALVRFRPASGPASAFTAAPGASTRRFAQVSEAAGRETALVRAPGMATADLLARLADDPAVERAWPNWTRRAGAVPDDTRFPELWGLQNTGQSVDGVVGVAGVDVAAPAAWEISTGSPDVVVAVLDTGVDYTHLDLAANLWTNAGEIPGNGVDDDFNGYVDDLHGIDAVNHDTDPYDDHGHGTHVAGTIAALGNNGRGVAGVAWQARVLALKFLDGGGSGTDADALECLEYAVDLKRHHGVNLVAVNASWGGGGGEDGDPLWEAIRMAGEAGIAFVAAAGNDRLNVDLAVRQYPASYDVPSIVAVAAVDSSGRLAGSAPGATWGSNYGATSVDLAAPGDNVLSTLPRISYVPSPGDPFFDDMEGAGRWVGSGTPNTWAVTEEGAASGTHAWSDSPGGLYPDFADTLLTLADPVDLRGRAGDALFLGFSAKLELEDWSDFLVVEVSGDGGAHWRRIGSLTGTGMPWQPYAFHVPVPERTASFLVRFRVTSDFSVQADGVLIDDVGIGVGAPSDDYGFSSGTSMATPHVTGALALVAAAYPATDVHGRIARVLSGVAPLPELAAVTVTGGLLNLAAALDPALSAKPLLVAATPARGLNAGETFTVSGRHLGAGPGQVLFAPALRTAQFLLRFRLQTSRATTSAGAHLDDVRLESPSTVWFQDDMESGGAAWVSAGVNDRWALVGPGGYCASSCWADSPGASYANDTDAALTLAAPLDLTGSAGQPLTLSYRLDGSLENRYDALTVEASPDGGATWQLLRSHTGILYNDPHRIAIPDGAAPAAAEIVAWSDSSVTARVPAGWVGGSLRLARADGTPSLNALAVSAWEEAPSVIALRRNAAAAAHAGRLYVFGGWDYNENATDSVEVYDPRTRRWAASGATRMPRPRAQAEAVSLGGRIYLLGGYDRTGGVLRAVDSFDPALGAWRGEPDLPTGLRATAAAAIGGRIYVAGGFDDLFVTHDETWMFDPAVRAWSRLEDMGRPRYAHAGAAHGGKLYVFGGYDPAADPIPTWEAYDPATGHWTTGAGEIPVTPASWSAASDGSAILLAGERGLLRFDPADGSWDVGTWGLEHVAKSAPRLAWVPASGLYMVGGSGTPASTSEVLRLDTGRTVERVAVLFPGRGTPLMAGRPAAIVWDAPAAAATFSIQASLDGGATWLPVAARARGRQRDWTVPKTTGPHERCRVRVQGFDAAGAPVGPARLSAPFTVNTVRLLQPDGAERLHPGERATIAWASSGTARPAARARLEWSADGGASWSAIRTLGRNTGTSVWTVPAASSGDCRVRVTLLDAAGGVLGVDASDAPFAVRP